MPSIVTFQQGIGGVNYAVRAVKKSIGDLGPRCASDGRDGFRLAVTNRPRRRRSRLAKRRADLHCAAEQLGFAFGGGDLREWGGSGGHAWPFVFAGVGDDLDANPGPLADVGAFLERNHGAQVGAGAGWDRRGGNRLARVQERRRPRVLETSCTRAQSLAPGP